MQPLWYNSLAVFICFFVGCNASLLTQRTRVPDCLRGSAFENRERLLKRIPIGTSRAEAENAARSLGLEVKPPSAVGVDASKFIQCEYKAKTKWFGETMWLIQIDCEDGKVTDLFCEQLEIEYPTFP